tara:strand:- start:996 stop:1727 length:732 start_codon:yes stop_codon:yes gene_type:complete
MQIHKSLISDIIEIGGFWELLVDVNGYDDPSSKTLVTQIAIGRSFEIIENGILGDLEWIKVRLLEDGYKCWIPISDVLRRAIHREYWEPNLLNSNQIRNRLPNVLDWIEKSALKSNKYLWGGTIGPDFDCSGLVQAAFSSEGIWLPRDAYQQEAFCTKVQFDLNTYKGILPGDLIFFGTQHKCNHVAIYKDNGSYWHSSGTTNGSNGIGINFLSEQDQISSFYFSKIRSIGRVSSCHDGTSMP